ncbi:MAG TPA: nucleotide exchange factor GrpE [Lysobacter sp.]
MLHRTCLALAAAAALAVPVARAESRVELAALIGVGGQKSMRTLRDMRFLDMTPQRYDFSCGSAALATLLSSGYGLKTTEEDLIRWMMEGADTREIIRNGFSMLDMKRYVEHLRGFRAHGFKVDADALYRLQMPVIALLDHLRLAVEHADEAHRPPLEALHEEFLTALGRLGIEAFAPVHEPFDPNEHEAMAAQPSEDAESGTVIEVYQQGYRLNGAVLRPARVVVAE